MHSIVSQRFAFLLKVNFFELADKTFLFDLGTFKVGVLPFFEKLSSIDFDIALFFSPSGVRCFAELNYFENIDCFAIGESTANELRNYTKKIHIAKKPTIKAM